MNNETADGENSTRKISGKAIVHKKGETSSSSEETSMEEVVFGFSFIRQLSDMDVIGS